MTKKPTVVPPPRTGKGLNYCLLLTLIFFLISLTGYGNSHVGLFLVIAGFITPSARPMVRRLGQAGCNPSNPGYTMAGPPYGFQLVPLRVGLRILKPLLLHFVLKTAG